MRNQIENQNKDGGYVLILALVSLVVLSLGLTVAAEQMSVNQYRLSELRKARDFQIKAYSVENELAYVLAKDYFLRQPETIRDQDSRISRPGREADILERANRNLIENFVWNEILLGIDVGMSDLVVEVHNRKSLIDLNSKSEAYMQFWAKRLGGAKIRNFIDALSDYTDADNFVRPRGAEQEDYDELDVIVPNRPLRSIQEICNVLFWKELDVCDQPLQMARLFYVDNGDWIRMRVASEVMKSFALEELYGNKNLGSQLIAWEALATAHGFFDYGLLGGEAGPNYVLIMKSDKTSGIFRRVELGIRPVGSSRPIEILGQWQTSFISHDVEESKE